MIGRNRIVCALLASIVVPAAGIETVAQSHVKGWGARVFDSQWNSETFAEISVDGASLYTLARRGDGSIVAWGWNNFGQCDTPALPTGLAYIDVEAGYSHAAARRSDGSVVAWGSNVHGQCDVPPLPAGLTYVELDLGQWHTLARRSDGSAVGWGANADAQCDVPPLPVGISYVEVSGLPGICHRCNSTH